MIAIIVFVAVPVASVLYAKSLQSLALSMFHHRNRDDVETTKVEEEREEDGHELEDGLELDCVVCLCQVSRGEKYRLLSCNHGFHVHCINSWLRAHSTCPLCRIPVAPLSPHHPHDDQQQNFYDGLVSCLFSPLENLCKWLESPLNSELMSALYQNSCYRS